MSDGGKGSKPRPLGIDRKTFDSNWDRIFNREKKIEAELQEAAWLKDEYYDLDHND